MERERERKREREREKGEEIEGKKYIRPMNEASFTQCKKRLSSTNSVQFLHKKMLIEK